MEISEKILNEGERLGRMFQLCPHFSERNLNALLVGVAQNFIDESDAEV